MTPLFSRRDLVRPVPRKDDDFLGRIVGMDKTWAVSYEPNLKRQSIEWKHLGPPRPKKVRPTQCAMKVMSIVAYGNTAPRCSAKADGLPTCCTFLQDHLHPEHRRKIRHLVVQNSIILHANAKSHTAVAITDLLRHWKWNILEHPPYSPYMSPCDYDLLDKVKEPLRGTRFITRDEFIRAIGRSVRNINKDGRVDGVLRLPNIWKNVISKDGRLY